MVNKIVFFASTIVFLIGPSRGISLSSGHDLEKRASKHHRSWWTWSSQGGFHSGGGYSPASSSSSSSTPSVSLAAGVDINSPSSCSNCDAYSNIFGEQTTPASDSYSAPPAQDSYQSPQKAPDSGSDSYAPKTKPAPNGPKTSTNASDIKQWLDYHNRFRAQYAAKPLTWNDQLVSASKRLTDTCVWRHTQNNEYGENMSAGQTSIKEVVEGWVTGPNEKDSYTGPNTEPSHFTQVVWLGTTQVGCYSGTCQNVRGANLPQSPVTFWACNYNPPGNVIGEFAENVKAAPGGTPSY